MLDPCNPNPCPHGGTCHSSEGRYMCACPEGYYGNECMSLKNTCIGQHCPGNTVTCLYYKVLCDICIKYLYICRCHVRHNTQRPELLHGASGCLSFSNCLWVCSLCAHLLAFSSQEEKTAGCATGRGHQQPEGVCQPHQKRGPSCTTLGPYSSSKPHSSPCPSLSLLRGNRIDTAAFPSPLTTLPSAKATTCPQTGHFKSREGETEPYPLHRKPGAWGLTRDLSSFHYSTVCSKLNGITVWNLYKRTPE